MAIKKVQAVDLMGTDGIFDVSNDPWLGVANGFRLVAKLGEPDRIVVLEKSGRISVRGKARKALQVSKKMGSVAGFGDDAGVQLYRAAVAEQRLRDLIWLTNQSVYKGMEPGERFCLVFVESGVRDADWGLKAGMDSYHGKDASLVHKKEGGTEGSTSWFNGPVSHAVVLTESEGQAWAAAEKERCSEAGLSKEEYRTAHGVVNSQALRLAAAIGKGAVARPFDPGSQEAVVLVPNPRGAVSIKLICNSIDLMDVTVGRDGVALATAEDLTSVDMPAATWSSVLGERSLNWNEMTQGAYKAWASAMTKMEGQANVALGLKKILGAGGLKQASLDGMEMLTGV